MRTPRFFFFIYSFPVIQFADSLSWKLVLKHHAILKLENEQTSEKDKSLKQELSGTKAYEQTSEKEKSVINNHIFHNATRFAVSVNEDQERLPTFYWLPKLHKKPYKARFIANSSSCTTTELSKLLTSCLTTIKNHVIKYCEKVYERSGKNLFWSIKNTCEVLNKLKSRGFRASSLSTYDFSTLYTTLPHNLIKDKLVDLIERTFQREALFILHVMIGMLSSHLMQSEIIIYGLVRKCVKLSPFS